MICEQYGEDKADTMRRSVDAGILRTDGYVTKDDIGMEKVNDVLCSRCCSALPGREWMREQAS